MRRCLFAALLVCLGVFLSNGCAKYGGDFEGQECVSDDDCPGGFHCDPATDRCRKDCVPDCAGKCCGSDGCGGACTDNCPQGENCDRAACKCEGAPKCETNEDCPRNYWCDRTVWRCRPIECVPNCTGKCCGSDGCDGVCPDNCPVGYDCNANSCQCRPVGCQTDADCMAYQCCLNGTCSGMECGRMECGPDPVCGMECGPCPPGYHCDQGFCVVDAVCNNDSQCAASQCCRNQICVDMACGPLECGPDPVCAKECGPCAQGYICANGRCEIDGVDLCPPGQECVQVSAEGVMGCVVPPNTIPPGNQTGCDQAPCQGNFTCYCLDATCSQSICIQNCGSCPTGTECCELMPDGPWGCLTPGCSDIPPNPPYCDGDTPCQGNAGCFTDGVNNFCIDLCSTNAGSCVDGERMCDGSVVLECVNGGWVDRVDCSDTQRVCEDGGCRTSYGLGEFCDHGLCAPGLDCLPHPAGRRSFCTRLCNCGTNWICDDGWECRFTNQPDNPTACWCGKMCPNRDPLVDCPNGGVDWECVVAEQDPEGDAIYLCIPGW